MAEAAKADESLQAASQNIHNNPASSEQEILKKYYATFSTNHKDAWESAIKSYYDQEYDVTERNIQDGIQINIFRKGEAGQKKGKILNVNIYYTGTIMLQGKEITSALEHFKDIKKLVDEVQRDDLGPSSGNTKEEEV